MISLQEEEEKRRAQELADQRWRDCLQCLKDSVPALKKNPWLIVQARRSVFVCAAVELPLIARYTLSQEPNFIHNYLDSLTETIANLSKYKNDLERVKCL